MGSPQRKPIKNFEGLYEISEDGTVYSLTRWTGHYTISERILKAETTRGGYLRVILCRNGKAHKKLVHRLVAETFIPNPQNYRQVNHIDSDRSNPHVNNLEWVSPKGNAMHSMTKGFSKIYNKMISWETRINIFNDYVPKSFDRSAKIISEKYGVGQQTVLNIYEEMRVLIDILYREGITINGNKYLLREEREWLSHH